MELQLLHTQIQASPLSGASESEATDSQVYMMFTSHSACVMLARSKWTAVSQHTVFFKPSSGKQLSWEHARSILKCSNFEADALFSTNLSFFKLHYTIQTPGLYYIISSTLELRRIRILAQEFQLDIKPLEALMHIQALNSQPVGKEVMTRTVGPCGCVCRPHYPSMPLYMKMSALSSSPLPGPL